MNWKKILMLLGVLLVLVVLVTIVNQQEAQKQESEGKLLTVASDRIAKFAIVRGVKTFVFLKKENHWNLESPIQSKADKTAVDNILDEFCSLKYDKQIEKSARDLKTYGLDQPEIELRLYEKDLEKPSYTIQLGIKNEIDSSSYARLASNNEVVMVAQYKRNYLEKELFDFRDKKVLNFDTVDVTGLRYDLEGASFSFSKKGDQWFLDKPIFSLAKESKTNDMVSFGSRLEAKAFQEPVGEATLKEYGFDRPLLAVAYKVKDREKTIKVVKKNETYFASTGDSPEICQIEKDFIEKFGKEAKEVRESRVAQFYSFDVKEFTFKSKELNIAMKKDSSNNWQLTSPQSKKNPAAEKVSSLLSAFEELEATDFIDRPDTRTVFAYTVILKTAGGEKGDETKTIELLLTEAKDNALTVRNASLPYFFKTGPSLLEKLPKKLDDLLEEVKEIPTPK